MSFNHALIIEDDPFTQTLITEFISDLNIATVSQASDGQQGMNSLINNTPDLILLDINMPILDGYQVIDQLANTNYPGKIVLISGTSMTKIAAAQLLAKWSNLDVGDFLIKPFTQSDLINAILS